MHIGNKVRELVRGSELSVIEFAQKIGVAKQHIYYIYERPHINTELLEKICEALEVPIKIFFVDETEYKVEANLINENKELIQKVELLNEKIYRLTDALNQKDQLVKINEARIEELKTLLLAYDKINNLLSK